MVEPIQSAPCSSLGTTTNQLLYLTGNHLLIATRREVNSGARIFCAGRLRHRALAGRFCRRAKPPYGLERLLLGEKREPLHVLDVGQREGIQVTLAEGKPDEATVRATLYASILRDINTKGKDARFKKVERGQFAVVGKK